MPATTSVSDTVVIPDLVNSSPFEFLINPLDHITSRASDRWLEAPGTLATKKQRAAQAGLNAGLLASMCWPKLQNRDRLQVCADFVNYLFHLDDLTDEMDAKSANCVRDAVMGVMENPELWSKKIQKGEAHAVSVLMYNLWIRIVEGAGPLVQKRFVETMDAFFAAITDEAADRKKKKMPSITEYIIRRRDNGAVRPCLALIEYANEFELPEHVWSHPVVRNIEDWANDLISWANDILSFGPEYSRGDTHNIVIAVMHEKHLTVQEAMDYAGALFNLRVEEFLRARESLPTWGPDTDRMVQKYIEGLQYWVIGSTEWCFWTNRYFEAGMQVRNSRVMEFQHPQRD